MPRHEWAPDGRGIAFVSRRANGESQIWSINPEGGNPRQITRSAGEHNYPSWSRDGAWIYFSKDEGAGVDIWRIAAAGGQEVQITHGGGSPDSNGRWPQPCLQIPN